MRSDDLGLLPTTGLFVELPIVMALKSLNSLSHYYGTTFSRSFLLAGVNLELILELLDFENLDKLQVFLLLSKLALII